MSIRPLMLEATGTIERDAAIRSMLIDRLEPSYRLAVVLLGDRSLAEDATHDAIVRALGAAGGLRDVAAFEPWFRRILVNACRDIQRRRVRRPAVPLEPIHLEQAAYDPGQPWIEQDAMWAALGRLSHDHREVVVLRYHAELSIDEIARSTGSRPGTVRSRLHYALRRLRAEYEATGRASQESPR